jgi:hypothetical protein
MIVNFNKFIFKKFKIFHKTSNEQSYILYLSESL